MENKRSLEYALQKFLGVFNVEMFILNLSAEPTLRNWVLKNFNTRNRNSSKFSG